MATACPHIAPMPLPVPSASSSWSQTWLAAAGQAGNHKQELGEAFNAGGVSEQQPVGDEEQQQKAVLPYHLNGGSV